jgi:hypothetical protein
MINEQRYITSVVKIVQKASKTGKMNSKILQVFNLYKYYINFAQELSDNGSEQFEESIVLLKTNASKLQYKYPDIICNYKVIIPNDTKNIGETVANTAPTVSSNDISLGNNDDYQFKVGDFVADFTDVENDSWKYLLIYPLVNVDSVLKTGMSGTVDVISPIIINIEGLVITDLISLFIKRIGSSSFNSSFTFRVSDDNINYLYSALRTIDITASTLSSIVNLSPEDIGDNTLYTTNRATTILTLAMFTTGLVTPYSDPEGDLLDAIRIIDISNANAGIYYIYGIPIVEGQIIAREDIEVNAFTHEGPDTDTISSDTFEFEARDEGSQIWIG